MVDPDSGWVSRAPPYSGYCWRLIRFGYAALTPYGSASQRIPLPLSFCKLVSQSYNPARGGLGSSPFARRYLGNLY